MGGIVVFLGPTIDARDAAKLLTASYWPPVAQGDVVRAIDAHDPDALVIIDGAFASTAAVRHKEILWALSRGVAVFGAASMGALRAAELTPFGMCGHGVVYRWYRATPMADDDEVAVAMAPAGAGAAALSEALINIRLTLRRAERAGVIDAALSRMMIEQARATYFPRRSYESLIAAVSERYGTSFAGSELAAWLKRNARDVKREDAESLLRRLAVSPPRRGTPHRTFEMTDSWAADLAQSNLLRVVEGIGRS